MNTKNKSRAISGTTSGLSGLFAILGGVCCWGPLFFSIAGITASTGGALGSSAYFLRGIAPYRNYFLILNILGVLLSFYLIYIMPQISFKKSASKAGKGLNGKTCSSCETKTAGSFNISKVIFFLSIVITIVVFMYLYMDTGTIFTASWLPLI